MSEWISAGEMAKRLGIGTAGVRYRALQGDLEMRVNPQRKCHFQYRELDAEHHTLEDPTEEPVEALVARQVARSRRARGANEVRKRVVRIQRDEPFAVVHMGDPHVDDDGCDWDALIRDVETINATEGMYAGNVGDTVNNWVGKLIGKYKQQGATESEAFKLGKWLFHEVPYDYIILGNHDHWNQGGSLFREFSAGAQVSAFADHEARIEYFNQAGATFRLNVRHDFKGHSMWNNTHGMMKRAKMRPWGDLLVCGHKHCWGQYYEEAQPGRCAMSIRVRGYKRDDEYAEAKDFPEDSYGCSLTTVIDMSAHPGDRCKLFHDVELAAEYLEWLRSG